MEGTRLHSRYSIRLPGADYSVPGFFFVTICTKGRECLFGEVTGEGEMVLNECGKIVQEEWEKTAQIRPGVVLDEFIVMPNHIHAIILITDNNLDGIANRVGAHSCAPLQPGDERPFERLPRSIGSLVAGLKSAITTRINTLRNTPANPVWQRNYHEHIIRDQKSLEKIRIYIRSNPFNWSVDLENNLVRKKLMKKEIENNIRRHFLELFK